MRNIAINDYIAARGISGSSRTANFIKTALSSSNAVHELKPASLAGTKVGRLVEMVKWDFWDSPVEALKLNSESIIHCTNVGLPRANLKSIVVVHDLMALDHPDLFSRAYVGYLRLVMPLSVRKSSAIVCPSDHSRKRVLARWPEARAITIPWSIPGGRNECRLERRPESPHRSRNVLVVSSIDKHKRLDLAVTAVSVARATTGIPLTLTIVGRQGNAEAELTTAIGKYDVGRKWVRRVSGINDADLNDLYSNSFCLLVPSLDEGFCLPVMEGGKHGLPAVHTGRGALNEVASKKIEPPDLPEDDIITLVNGITELLDDSVWDAASRSEMTNSMANPWNSFVGKWQSVIKEVN